VWAARIGTDLGRVVLLRANLERRTEGKIER